jgi:hypothetical protein
VSLFRKFALRHSAPYALLLVTSLVAIRCIAQSSEPQGQWSPVATWPTRAIHTTLLPDGRVFFFSYYTESLQPHIWDPVSNTFSATAAAPYELFCAGHTSLPDGRVFISGGHIADYTGFAHALIYNGSQNTFTALPDMNEGRWYPNNTVLANGDVLVVSGDVNSNTNVNPLPQVYQMATNSWRSLTSAQLSLPLYPSMLLAPNGKVFMAGPAPLTRYIDTSGTGVWSNVATKNFTAWRDYGPVVMYDSGKIIAIGGGDPPTATAEIIDLNAATPVWKLTGSMHQARRQHNAVVLPDGKIFVSGGSSASGFDTSTSPVYPTEMWDPATGQFTTMASIAEYRGYHSTALLLPDGRVLSAGGNVGGPNAQVFSPPYLFNGARPTISSAPTSAGYGQTISILSPDAANIAKVSLIHTGSTTHTFDMSQRFTWLNFTRTTTGLNISMPANANLAPPGYYMLFILNAAGVPSVGSVMQISSTAASTGALTGTITSNAGAPLLGVSVVVGGNGAVTAADGTFTLPNLTAGNSTVTASLAGYANASQAVTIVAGSSTSLGTLQLTPINPGAITGLVINSAGTGIAGASVTAKGLTISTDASGKYTFSNIPAGADAITASATGFTSASETVTATAGATVTAPPLTLVSGSGTVTGTVKNSAGTAIAGASVGFGGGTAITSSTGGYTLSSVPTGTVQLVASASGYQSVTQSVAVSAGATVTANFVLTPSTSSGAVTGKVTNASSGAILVGATVSWSGGTTTTSSTGVYTLSNVTAGSQKITASAPGYLPRSLTASVTSGVTTTLNLAIATAGKIAVKVTSSTGAAVSGATITVKGGVVATTVIGTTGSTGIFTTNWIPVGSYTITASETGHTTQTKTASVTSGVTTNVSITSF